MSIMSIMSIMFFLALGATTVLVSCIVVAIYVIDIYFTDNEYGDF